MKMKPQLVKNQDGKVCIQISLGANTATLEIPDHLAGQTDERMQAFFQMVVPEMTKGLVKRQNEDRRKRHRKVLDA